jgi:hypothetical protein
MVRLSNIQKSVPKRHENGPRRVLRGPFCLVALERVCSNTLLTVTVAGIDLTDDQQIMAVCARDRSTQHIPILDVPLPTPQPDGAEWIAAYRRWVKRA